MHPAIERLIQLRDREQITAREIAAQLQTSERNVWRWLNNNNQPSAEFVEKIEQFCDDFITKKKEEHASELKRSMSLIMDKIYDGSERGFLPIPKAHERVILATYKYGSLFLSLSLSDCGEATGKLASDPLLIECVEALARTGKIKISELDIHKKLGNDDILFRIFLGSAERQPFQEPIAERLFRDKPLSKTELEEPGVILNIAERIDELRKEKRKHFENTLATKDMELESELLKEEREDASELRLAQLHGGKMKDKKKDKTKEPDDQFEEVKFTNKRRSPEAFRDAFGELIIIEPGETKKFMRRKKIKAN